MIFAGILGIVAATFLVVTLKRDDVSARFACYFAAEIALLSGLSFGLGAFRVLGRGSRDARSVSVWVVQRSRGGFDIVAVDDQRTILTQAHVPRGLWQQQEEDVDTSDDLECDNFEWLNRAEKFAALAVAGLLVGDLSSGGTAQLYVGDDPPCPLVFRKIGSDHVELG